MSDLVKSSLVLKAIEKFVRDQYTLYHTDSRPFHTWKHVCEIFKAASAIMKNHTLTKEEKFIVRSSLWFQSVGYLQSGKDSLKTSAITADYFLQAYQIPKSIISDIKQTILATQIPQQPKNICQVIVFDAVLFYLGSNKFRKYSKLLRKEEELVKGHAIDKLRWFDQNITFMSRHKYFSEYMHHKKDQVKTRNLQYLMSQKSKRKEVTH